LLFKKNHTWACVPPGFTREEHIIAPLLIKGLCGSPSSFKTNSLKFLPEGSLPTWAWTRSSPLDSCTIQ